MKKGLLVLCCMVLAMASVGCVRSYVSTKERVDVEVAGNQGIIYGPTPPAHKVENPTRDIYVVDVELPTGADVKKTFSAAKTSSDSAKEDKTVTGNAGVVSHQPEDIK